MKIVLAGGSGFLGRALSRRLVADGHQVTVLTRQPAPGGVGEMAWSPDGAVGPWVRAIDEADTVVNLAGGGIEAKRWSTARKQELLDSRVRATRSVVAALHSAGRRPRVLISSSAIGYYGAHGDEVVTEETPPGTDFLAQLCVQWEQEAHGVPADTRLAVVRTGIVLHPGGGALGKMVLPFKLGVGGPLGNGRQFMSWIHLADWVGLMRWIIATDAAQGVFNATAPAPVRNADFARALGAALHRPALLPTPAFALRIALGEFATFLVTGARVVPAHAQRLGFPFQFPDLDRALAALLGG